MNDQAVCTIATKNYLSYAKTLMASVKQHHPSLERYILLADRVSDDLRAQLNHESDIQFLYIEDYFQVDEIVRMAFYYTPFEFCNGLRGFLHDYLYQKTALSAWLYLDSDILVLNSLAAVFQEFEASTILLNPHTMTPVPDEYTEIYEIPVITNGLYNSGFLGLRRSPTTAEFIQWFKKRLIRYSFHDRSHGWPRGLFVDQQWLNLVPLYFADTALITHPGVNLAHWNLYRRELSQDAQGNFFVDSFPLIFTHFSGWDPNDLNQVSKYAHTYTEGIPDIWLQLAQTYQEKLLINGHDEFNTLSYGFDSFKDGGKITATMREYYFYHLNHGTWNQGDPFQCADYFHNLFSPSIWKKAFRKFRGLINHDN